jgi:uroporphyrinogen decarboxylase
MEFAPDYKFIIDAVSNKKPARLPIYEHAISPLIMEKILNTSFAHLSCSEDTDDLKEYFDNYCLFFRKMTYDTVSFEVCVTEILPGSGALLHGGKGPIQTREDFQKYPWDEAASKYWEYAEGQFTMLGQCLPPGMKAVGGVGNGVFEISQDLVGYEHLCYMYVDDPDLFTDLYTRIGDVMLTIWSRFLQKYASHFVICRMGDDLGFKTGTLQAPEVIRKHIIPQYKRIIELIHKFDKPFLFHSCGKIFDVMNDVIEIGVNAKHSNEDAIAPFDEWIEKYGDRIGLFGGIDVNQLCLKQPAEVFESVLEMGTRFRNKAQGYALGSGNSIPDYVPVDSYLAMVEAAQQIRIGTTRNRVL